MRNFSTISILLVLAIGAIAWYRLLDQHTPEPLPSREQYAPVPEEFHQEPGKAGGCDDGSHDSEHCYSGGEATIQTEMEDQRRRAYGSMMKSFDDGYGKYREQIRGAEN